MKGLPINLVVAVAMASLLASAPCSAERGQVIDEATKKPIAGAFVFARWSGSVSNPVISHMRCYHFAITQTDKDGRFSLPDYSLNLEPWLTERHRSLSAYAPGYELSPAGKANSPEMIMRPYVGPALARLERITSVGGGGCFSENDKRVLPLYEAMYEEAKVIAKEREELRYLVGLRAEIASIKLGKKEFDRQISSGEFFKR